MTTEIVGKVHLGTYELNVYSSLNDPLFRATEVANLIEYSEGNTYKLVNMCEKDETLKLPMVVAGQTRHIRFVTELGLYNILSQSRLPIARQWRRIVHEELIRMRKANNKTIEEQFEEWDHALDDYYYDEENDCLMKSVTIPGGDVIQVKA